MLVLDAVASLPLALPVLLSPTAGAPSPAPLPEAEPAVAAAVAAARNWLADHQDEDGKWDADEFGKHDPEGEPSGGPGQAQHDVAVTGLALLAFLGDGHTTREGEYRDTVVRAVDWLRGQQDFETGLIGEKVGHSYNYEHGIATLALCEAYRWTKSPLLRGTAQKAVNYVLRARNPYGAWRYDCPPVGDNDTSVTGWMVSALYSAKDAGLQVDEAAFRGARDWLDEVTDAATGRVGYDSMGSGSSRVPGVNDRYPTDRTETMTASGLLQRFLLGEEPGEDEVMEKHADLMLKALPDWSPRGDTNDVYYWYHGTFAMFRMGGKHWQAWSEALRDVILAKQIDEGSAAGSWDPDGPWGWSGGRVYATAMGIVCLETYYSYDRLYGAR
jgi:hypothetical protein